MLEMILKMSAVTIMYVALTVLMWKNLKGRKMTVDIRIAIGMFYGILCIFSTHFGIDYGDMLLNVRDLGPMCAGLFFDPAAGIIAGIIGGAERYIAGQYFNIGYYTRVACGVSTCMAGFFAAFMTLFIFKRKKPSPVYAFFLGAVIEVFHMYVVFITHGDDMAMAFMVVKTCALPMIIFSAIGLSLCAAIINHMSGIRIDPFRKAPSEEVPVSQKFQLWLFAVTAFVLVLSFGFNYRVQTQSALQEARDDIDIAAGDLVETYEVIRRHDGNISHMYGHVGMDGLYSLMDADGNIAAGEGYSSGNSTYVREIFASCEHNSFATVEYKDSEWLCQIRDIDDGSLLLVMIPYSEVFASRELHAYETLMADILLFTTIYLLISLLVQLIVVNNLELVNKSLAKITDGDLNEKVSVYESSEFASLSNDINETVNVLKGYISAAEKRIEQELTLAHNIQEAALPKNFTFTHKGFEIYALMDPAREVGGDFYDFFFVDTDRLALVIADVSGKGIPASLFMMRSKSAIRSLAETGNRLSDVFARVSDELCENNDINMFVTAWMGIIDLKSGTVDCVNAGHEYPAIMHSGGRFELLKDRHRPPLGVMEGLTYEEYQMQLDPGDIIFVYTDGVPEAINIDEKQYGTDRMINMLSAHEDESMEGLLTAVRADLEDYVGSAEQFDDITMLGFRFGDSTGL